MCRVLRIRGLGDLGVVTPYPLVGGRISRCYIGILFSNKVTAWEFKKVGMNLIAPIGEMHIAVINGEFSKQDCLCIGLIFISQQPGIVAFARSRVGNVGEIDL